MSKSEVKLDHHRANRIGIEEAIYCAGKSDAQIETILSELRAVRKSCLLTRLSAESYARISTGFRGMLDYEPASRTAFFNWRAKQPGPAQVAVLTAGSSDVPVAREAIRTLTYAHVDSLAVFDVGVAGLWRLTERMEEIRAYPVAIVAAGMDAALPSVVGGLFPGLIIAIPTSVGYGVAAGGTTALNAILASCASGITTVNIDNGYGAACAALRALNVQRRIGRTVAADEGDKPASVQDRASPSGEAKTPGFLTT
ncbi:nickel pincer cofactor biosynthesis protein LarB [Thiobacillus sp.]|uniref:nickel pincer cofactor biosynthesis protein LarB n=1 Tax=Thiobacillus sp. TaxID=924 RepID=UPI0025D5175C|nr:nickel pincer cofactor biosynthesis protein LarB [Thiobacillus sp.]